MINNIISYDIMVMIMVKIIMIIVIMMMIIMTIRPPRPGRRAEPSTPWGSLDRVS